MKLLAIIVLATAQLLNLSLPTSWEHSLETRVVQSQPSAELVKLLPHAAIAQPIKTGASELKLGAVSALAWDVDSATTLYEINPLQPLPIASITKLMTVLVILKSHQLTESVTIPALPAYKPEDAKMGLTSGQTFVLKDLLAAALIPSANDAADALAIWDSGTIAAFSAKMNRLAQDWGIEGVRFSNPSGLIDQDNYANARALAQIGKLAMTNGTVRQLVATSQTSINDTAGHTYVLTSTDQLLSDGRVKGLKTGFTAAAGQCFMSLAVINGHQVITVVLNSPNRFSETEQLINWIQQNYQWQ